MSSLRFTVAGSLGLCLILLATLLSTTTTDAQSSSSAKKSFWSLEERLQKLTDLSYRKPMIRLNVEKFRQFIGAKGSGQPVRNYSMIVMLTALSAARQCSVCHAAADEFTIVANSWRYSQAFTPNLFFGYVDFDEGGEIFSQLGLNTAPVFIYFGERSVKTTAFSLRHGEQMDIQRIGFAAETISRWVAEKTGTTIRVVRPPNYTATMLFFAAFSLLSVLLYLRRDNLGFLFNKTAWGAIALAIVFTMTSGQMWNHIRGAPLMHRSRDGVAYIHTSSSGQFIMETYIIFGVNAAITVGFILLVESMKSGGKMLDAKKKQFFAVAGLVLVAFFFSLMMSVFRMKTPGYPYSFLLK